MTTEQLDAIWVPAAKCASAVGTAQGFLQGIETEYPSLPKQVRHAAGEIAKQLDTAWNEMRVAIEGNHADALAAEAKRLREGIDRARRILDRAPYHQQCAEAARELAELVKP